MSISTSTRRWGFAAGRLHAVDFLQANTTGDIGQGQPIHGSKAMAVGALAGFGRGGDAGESLGAQQALGAEVEHRHAGRVEDVAAEFGHLGLLDGGDVEGDEVLGDEV